MSAIRQVQVTFDCADPGALSEFWRQVLGYAEEAPPAPFTTWDEALDAWGIPAEHRNDFAATSDADKMRPAALLPEGPGGQDGEEPRAPRRSRRARPPGRRADGGAVRPRLRLVGLGATRLQRFEPGGVGAGHIVMGDPEGNEFCLD